MTLSSETPLFPARGAHLFQPPTSPSSAPASPVLASPSTAPPTTTDYFASRTRKRHRPDSSHSHSHSRETVAEQHSPYSTAPSWTQCATPGDAAYLGLGTSVNERYRLAGGYDTPGLLAASETEIHDHDFRRCVRDMEPSTRQESRQSTISGPLARERNGVARVPSSPNGDAETGRGWTTLAFEVVGKVFSFGTSVIKGFYAGGGKGFDLQKHGLQDSPPADSWMQTPAKQSFAHTPIPGAWHNGDEFLGDLEHDNPDTPTLRLRPPNKRRQTDRDSWVLVGTPETQALDTSPKRKLSGITPRPGLAPRSSASRANSRRSIAPISRRQSSYNTTIPTHTTGNFGQPAIHPLPHPEAEAAPPFTHRRASLAQTRASHSRPSSAAAGVIPSEYPLTPNGTTYITPETERYLKRQARQDKAADRAMNSMSKQLEDLIRQGREALGTKVSVEGDAESAAEEVDEGFVDEEW